MNLVVYEGIVVLGGDDSQIYGHADLGGSGTGDIGAEAGFLADDAASTQTLPIALSDFSVWDLSALAVAIPTAVALPAATVAASPVLPPIQGTSVIGDVFEAARTAALGTTPSIGGRFGTFSQTNDLFDWDTSAVSVQNFCTIVTFDNPTDYSTPSDVGIGFRASNGNTTGYRIIVRSDGSWYFELAGQQPVSQGTAAGFDQLPGVSNTIELLVQGGTAILAINGVVQAPVDVSAIQTPGDVYVGTGFLGGDTVAGRRVPYRDWWIYPLSV